MTIEELHSQLIEYLVNDLILLSQGRAEFSNSRPNFQLIIDKGLINQIYCNKDYFEICFNDVNIYIRTDYLLDDSSKHLRYYDFFKEIMTNKEVQIKLLKAYKHEKSNYFHNILKNLRTNAHPYVLSINILDDDLSYQHTYCHYFTVSF